MESIKLIICKDKNEIDKIASNIISETMKDNKKPVLGLATGKSPIGIYKNLISKFNNGEISFKKTLTFNLDEYLGLKEADHNNSYEFYMSDNLFDKVDIKKKNTYFPTLLGKKENKDWEKFEKILSKKGPIDIQLLGLGTNGHIGFNEPGSSITSRTRVVDLTPSTIKSNSVYFKSKDDVPTQAVSMGLGTILEAKKIILVAFGKEKSDAIKKFFDLNEFDEELPMSSLITHNDTYIVIDEAAASKLNKTKIKKFLLDNK